MARKATLRECEQFVLEHGEPELRSGRQEMLENLVHEVSSRSLPMSR